MRSRPLNLWHSDVGAAWVPLLAVLAGIWLSAPVGGDEVVINHSMQRSSFGDFSCSPVLVDNSERLNLGLLELGANGLPGHCCEIKTGELYRYFKAQGITSMSNLVFYVNVDDLASDATLSVESMQVSILGANGVGGIPGRPLVEFTSSDDGVENRMLISGFRVNDDRPAARLEIPLGFDFMSRFSENSNERLLVNMTYNGETGASPSLSIEGRRHLFSSPNLVLLGSFVVFWSVVFWILKRLTFRRIAIAPETAAGGPQPAPAAAEGAKRGKSKNIVPAA